MGMGMRTILSTINLKSTKEYPKPTYIPNHLPSTSISQPGSRKIKNRTTLQLEKHKDSRKQGSCAGSGEMGCKGGGDGGLGVVVEEVEGWKQGNERG